MAAVFSILLAVSAAALSHVSVRYVRGFKRSVVFGLALVSLSVSFYWGEALGGFWPGVYTLLSVFFLATVATPWIDLLLGRRRAD